MVCNCRGQVLGQFGIDCRREPVSPLDVRPGRFITSDRRHLSCGTHGARFRFEDGYCLAGPCKGQSLRRLEIAVEAGEIVLLEEPKVQTPEAPA